MTKLNFILLFGMLAFSSCKDGFVGAAISLEEFLTLSLSQKVALDKFRARVEPLLKENFMKQDIYLVRWLRSDHFDVNAAEKSFRDVINQSLKWRHENKIDTIRFEDFSDLTSDYHMTFDTYDKAGQPIGVIDIYDWDIRRAILQGKGQRLLRYVINLVENITTQVVERQEKGMNVTHVVILMNADGANVIQHGCPICLPLWIQFVQLVNTYYPLYLDEFIIVDAPPAVGIVFEAVKPFISKEARETFRIFGPNKNQWMTYLDKKISKDQRRERYGGTKAPAKY